MQNFPYVNRRDRLKIFGSSFCQLNSKKVLSVFNRLYLFLLSLIRSFAFGRLIILIGITQRRLGAAHNNSTAFLPLSADRRLYIKRMLHCYIQNVALEFEIILSAAQTHLRQVTAFLAIIIFCIKKQSVLCNKDQQDELFFLNLFK